MTETAPVCIISPDQDIRDRQPLGQGLPTIRPPTDLPSALRAINDLIRLVNILSGQQRLTQARPNTGPGASGFPQSNVQVRNSRQPTRPEDGRWSEIVGERVVEKVKIEQEGNPENYVVFNRINRLTYRDNITGETWSWVRGNTR